MRGGALMIAMACASASAGAQVLGPLGARLDSALRAAEAAGYSGVVRVDLEGQTILDKGYGLANRADKIPFTPGSVVQIGSNTKDFTMVALLQLQEQGRINFNDSLVKYFPAAPADKRAITVRQLMNHRAGFPIGLGGDFEPIGRRELIDQAMARPLGFPPGTKESYSNTGYSLLAAIIEQVTGTTYDQYVNEHILKPLGLRSTGLLLPGFDTRRVAHGYRGADDQGTMLSRPHATDGPYWNLRGNGGMLSTVDDMRAFYAALFGTETLMKSATRRLRFDPDEAIGLAGSDMVCSFLYARVPDRRLDFIIASNSAEWPERRVRDAIAPVLGLRAPNRAVAAATPKASAHAPAPAVASLMVGFIAAVNSGDETKLRTFVAEHFAGSAGSPSLAARVERMTQMHNNLGMLTLVSQDQTDPTTIELTITSASEGPVTIKMQIDASSMPPKIRGIQVEVG